MRNLGTTIGLLVAWGISSVGTASSAETEVVPIKTLMQQADLVAVLSFRDVHKIQVATDYGKGTFVYVGGAVISHTLKSDREPVPRNRKIAVVGSTEWNSLGGFDAIEAGRYLAFLNSREAHYVFPSVHAMRRVSPEGKVTWYEKNATGGYDRLEIPLEEAIARIKGEQAGDDPPPAAGSAETPQTE